MVRTTRPGRSVQQSQLASIPPPRHARRGANHICGLARHVLEQTALEVGDSYVNLPGASRYSADASCARPLARISRGDPVRTGLRGFLLRAIFPSPLFLRRYWQLHFLGLWRADARVKRLERLVINRVREEGQGRQQLAAGGWQGLKCGVRKMLITALNRVELGEIEFAPPAGSEAHASKFPRAGR